MSREGIDLYVHQVEAAKSISEKLWSVPNELEALESSLDKGGSIAGQQSEPPTNKDDGNCPQDSSSSRKDGHLHYQAFKKNAHAWLRRLQADTSKKTPSAEQLQCIQTVVHRCIQEARDKQNNVEYRSEPLRLILHGVPGGCFFSFIVYHCTCTWLICN